LRSAFNAPAAFTFSHVLGQVLLREELEIDIPEGGRHLGLGAQRLDDVLLGRFEILCGRFLVEDPRSRPAIICSSGSRFENW